MTQSQPQDRSVTELLIDWRGGDDQALESLAPKVYEELRRIAHCHLRGEKTEQTLSATDLLHETFLRLVDVDVAWNDRTHFFAVGARAMRRILVDRSRSKTRLKRGGANHRVTLDEGQLAGLEASTDLLELDRALSDLARLDPRKASIVELVYFGGLTYDEVAATLNISRATAHRQLRLAKAWLHDHIETFG